MFVSHLKFVKKLRWFHDEDMVQVKITISLLIRPRKNDFQIGEEELVQVDFQLESF